jgi:hypothetical protein
MNEKYFRTLLQELIDENPFSVRAVLKILDLQFTDSVPTLAVTREKQPRLLVNLAFLQEHCHTDQQVKAVIIHEFLHVLLRHTEDKRRMTTARHLAFDAVINAIIHRQCGVEYSAMMSSYYAKVTDLRVLLRPMTEKEHLRHEKRPSPHSPTYRLRTAWKALYEGKLIADDIESLVEEIARVSRGSARGSGPIVVGRCAGDTPENVLDDLLGNHHDLDEALPDGLQAVLYETMKEMNGSGIWRAPRSRGVGANPYAALFTAKDERMERWKIATLGVLRKFLRPDSQSRASHDVPLDYHIPVLSPGDRRAFMRSLWSPFLPDAAWSTTVVRKEGTAQVYLDVSGSMHAEMPLIIALLGRVSRYIRRPFWAFSDVVAPAVIESGQLKTSTSGGTSMTCVLEHLVKTRPVCAVIVTDGYIEEVSQKLIAQASATRIHALVTRDGNPSALRKAGITYTQLGKVPA